MGLGIGVGRWGWALGLRRVMVAVGWNHLVLLAMVVRRVALLAHTIVRPHNRVEVFGHVARHGRGTPTAWLGVGKGWVVVLSRANPHPNPSLPPSPSSLPPSPPLPPPPHPLPHSPPPPLPAFGTSPRPPAVPTHHRRQCQGPGCHQPTCCQTPLTNASGPARSVVPSPPRHRRRSPPLRQPGEGEGGGKGRGGGVAFVEKGRVRAGSNPG